MHVYKTTNRKVITAGEVGFTAVPTVLEGKTENVAFDGYIGLPILRRFHLLVDLPHNRVLFDQPVDRTKAFDTNHTGLTLAPDPEGAKVLYVALGSPADIAALKAKDLVTTLAGLKIKAWESNEGLTNWIYAMPCRHVRIGLQSGVTVPLMFDKYF